MGFDVGAWDYAKWGAAGYGQKDIDEAKKRGAGTYQLWQLADRAAKNNLKVFGSDVKTMNKEVTAAIGGARPNAPIDYASKQGWGFGVDDIDAMGGHKTVDLAKVRGARDWAADHGLSIGGGVNDHIKYIDQLQWQQRHDDRVQGLEDQANQDAKDQKTWIDDWGQKMVDEKKQSNDEWLAIQKEASDQAARVKGNNPTGVGSPASIRGSRLAITQPGGRRGTKRFARPTQYMNTLSAGTGSRSAVNLCDMRAKHEVALLKYTEVNDALATLAFAVQDIREHCNDS